MSLWTKVDSNADYDLWEAKTPGGAALRVTGMLGRGPPPDWMVKHHTDRYGDKPPDAELGATGVRYRHRRPDETEWYEYDYTPRKP